MRPFDDLVTRLLQHEGGYTNDPADSGGPSNFGITQATARAFGYVEEMAAMPREVAVYIYRKRYWDALSLDSIALLSPDLAGELFDSAVNCGPENPGKWLQRVLNVLNLGASQFPDLTVDGRIGPITVDAFHTFYSARGNQGVQVLVRALNDLQGAFYIGLAEAQPKDERFIYGWLLNRVS